VSNRTHTKFSTTLAIGGAGQTQKLDARTWADYPGAVFSELRIEGDGAATALYSFRDQVERTGTPPVDTWFTIPVAELARSLVGVNLRYVYIDAGGAANVIVSGTIVGLPNVAE